MATKTMRYELKYSSGMNDYNELMKCVNKLSDDTRTIKNKVSSIMWSYMVQGKNIKDETGKPADTFLYQMMTPEFPDMNRSSLASISRSSRQKISSSFKELISGRSSLMSYKKDQPIPIPAKGINISCADGKYFAELSLMSNDWKKANGYKCTQGNPKFQLIAKDKTQKTILDNLKNTYKLGESKLIKRKSKLFLMISYTFEPTKMLFDESRILGVDLGLNYALVASVFGMESKDSLFIRNGSLEYAVRADERRSALQVRAKNAGFGNVGHGRRKRTESAFKTAQRISNWQKTQNFKLAKDLCEFAVQNECGTIQMEDLSNIKTNLKDAKYLRHWTYYDLQQKIKNKAALYGINVELIDPAYTSQRCCKCGHIDEKNLPTFADFRCERCGFEAESDYNASQNIAVSKIDYIIEEKLKSANRKRTESA